MNLGLREGLIFYYGFNMAEICVQLIVRKVASEEEKVEQEREHSC